MADEPKPAEDPKPHVCPECGQSFALAITMGAHRRREHGVVGKTAGKGKKRPRPAGGPHRSAPTEGRKTKVKRTLVELADLSDDMRGRGGSELPEHLADVIRRDADQLATVISFAAEQLQPVKWFVDTVFVQVLAPVLGASGVVRWVLRQVRANAAAREQEPEEMTADDLAQAHNDWRAPTYGAIPVPQHDPESGLVDQV